MMVGKDVLAHREVSRNCIVLHPCEEGKKTGEGLEVTVEGRVTLHGVEKPISLPVRLSTRDGELRAGGASLLQTDFGINAD
jgi:polyisoprenoid-binding protein YceI